MVLLSCAAADCVKTFDLTTEELRLHHSIGALNAEVTCVRYNHNGKILATSGVDGGICLNVASSGELLSRFFYPAKNLTERRVNSVHFSSGSRFLVSGSHDGCVRIWDLKTQEVKQAYSVSASPVTAVTFSGFKDEHVVAGSECGALSIYDVRTSENAGFLTVDPRFGVSKVMAIQASPHPAAPHAVGATYADGSVRLWDLNAGQLAAEFVQQHEAAATALAISPVSKVLLATGGLDRRVLFYDTLQRKELRCIESDHPVTALSLCADGKTLAVGQSNGDIVIYDLRGSISPMFCATVHDTAMINALQFASPDTTTMNTTGATAGVTLPAPSSVHPLQPPGNNEQLSPPKAEYVHDLAMRKLQSFHIGAPPPVPVVATSQDGNALSPSKDAHMTSPTANPEFAPPTSTTSTTTSTPTPMRPSNFTISAPQTDNASVQAKPTKDATPWVRPTTPPKMCERRNSEPSLLAHLAGHGLGDGLGDRSAEMMRALRRQPQSQPQASAWAATRSELNENTGVSHAQERFQLHQQLQVLRREMETQNRAQVDHVVAYFDTFMRAYNSVYEENCALRMQVDAMRTQLTQQQR